VKLLVPLRTVRILPSADASITVASLPIADGAADIALLMSASSEAACCAGTATTIIATPMATTHGNTTRRIISTSCGVIDSGSAPEGSRVSPPRRSLMPQIGLPIRPRVSPTRLECPGVQPRGIASSVASFTGLETVSTSRCFHGLADRIHYDVRLFHCDGVTGVRGSHLTPH
jgi:hypothetical protein